MKKSFLIVFLPVLLMGCATLNRPECQNADWRMIGMEDGTKGLSPSYIGKHRSACAKYNVTPNLDQYSRGREEGLRQFCTEINGFNLGRNGTPYNDVCPADLKAAFSVNYDNGREYRSRLNELNSIYNDMQSDKHQIGKLRYQIKEDKQQLIKGQSTEIERAELLDKIEEAEDQIEHLEKKAHQHKRDYELQEYEFDQFRKQINH